jgi:hypothetical protein
MSPAVTRWERRRVLEQHGSRRAARTRWWYRVRLAISVDQDATNGDISDVDFRTKLKRARASALQPAAAVGYAVVGLGAGNLDRGGKAYDRPRAELGRSGASSVLLLEAICRLSVSFVVFMRRQRYDREWC